MVHEDHGVARFAGFDTKTVAGVTRDYLNLEYAGSDRVFMPVEQLAKISRYVGGGGENGPTLSKLGGTRWETLKARARKAAKGYGGELLNLYAERRRRQGHQFPPDTEWQIEFEEAFAYTETPDQRDAIEFVKADMESARPMDRLICGDVGFGKTEVAIRAAFKAVQDGQAGDRPRADDGPRPAAPRTPSRERMAAYPGRESSWSRRFRTCRRAEGGDRSRPWPPARSTS